MKVEFLTKFKHDGQTYEAGDTKTVAGEFGGYVCGLGWARDLSGQVETGEANTSETVTVEADNISAGTSARHK